MARVRRALPAHVMLAAAVRRRMAPRACPSPAGVGPPVVAGLLSSASGLGEAARLCYCALRKLDLDARAFDLTSRFHPDSRIPVAIADAADVEGQGPVLIHLNPPELPVALLRIGRRRLINRLMIGCWAWELPSAPTTWRFAFDHVHEVWVPSQFVAEALMPFAGAKRVRVVPHPVEAPIPIPGLRARLGLPEGVVLILAVVDVRSSFARKNPMGALRAFEKAVGDDMASHLVIKVSGACSNREAVASLQCAVAGRRNVSIITLDLAPADMGGLVAVADIVLSLHRAEGFGLPLAVAMAAGKPVIATGWSGNLQFMDAESSVLVPHKLVPVCDPQGIYEDSSQQWAEPDLDAAAVALRQLIHNPRYRTMLGAAAAARIDALLSLSRFHENLGGAFWAAIGTVPSRFQS